MSSEGRRSSRGSIPAASIAGCHSRRRKFRRLTCAPRWPGNTSRVPASEVFHGHPAACGQRLHHRPARRVAAEFPRGRRVHGSALRRHARCALTWLPRGRARRGSRRTRDLAEGGEERGGRQSPDRAALSYVVDNAGWTWSRPNALNLAGRWCRPKGASVRRNARAAPAALGRARRARGLLSSRPRVLGTERPQRRGG
jgi:hypothetical protein